MPTWRLCARTEVHSTRQELLVLPLLLIGLYDDDDDANDDDDVDDKNNNDNDVEVDVVMDIAFLLAGHK